MLIASLIAVGLTITGCIHTRVNMLEGRSVMLRQSAPPGLKISTSIYSDDGNLVILGRIKRGPLDLTMIPGHVDIVITDDKGEELSTIKATFRKIPTWRHGPSPVAFKAEFPGVPPAGSVVEVTYHTEQHH